MRNRLSQTSIIITLLFCSVILISQQRNLLGDVNNDGAIDVLDIVRIVNIIMENDPPPTEDELWASDVNADETTNVQDIVIIVQVIMETDDCPDLYSPCSDNLSLCCMDTTSHQFTWDIQIFGAPSGNINSLYDAHILDDDGFPSGLGGIRHTWGTNSENMYFSKHSGDIIHWDGFEFTIMETTTGSGSQYNPPFPILDLYGLDENHIWTIAGHSSALNENNPLKLSFYNGYEWTDQYVITSLEFDDSIATGRLYQSWAFGDTLYLSTSYYGLWRESLITGEGSYFPLDSLSSIDAGWSRGKDLAGNNHNDIFTVSQIAKYAHFNGATWYFGMEVFDFFESADLYQLCGGMKVKGNTIILYGDINLGQQVWVARGVRID